MQENSNPVLSKNLTINFIRIIEMDGVKIEILHAKLTSKQMIMIKDSGFIDLHFSSVKNCLFEDFETVGANNFSGER